MRPSTTPHGSPARPTRPSGTTTSLDLEALLPACPSERVVVAVESIYSVLGDAAPLVSIVETCARHGALLVVDEAHGIGVAGSGRGLVHELGLAGRPDVVVTATLSKSLGSQGGAVLGSGAVRDHLVNTARSFIFDTALAPAAAGAAAEAASIVAGDPFLAERVRTNAAVISRTCGIEIAAGAVQSVPMPSPESAVAAAWCACRRGRSRRLLPPAQRARRRLTPARDRPRRPLPRRTRARRRAGGPHGRRRTHQPHRPA